MFPITSATRFSAYAGVLPIIPVADADNAIAASIQNFFIANFPSVFWILADGQYGMGRGDTAGGSFARPVHRPRIPWLAIKASIKPWQVKVFRGFRGVFH